MFWFLLSKIVEIVERQEIAHFSHYIKIIPMQPTKHLPCRMPRSSLPSMKSVMIKIMKRVRSRPHFVANYLCRLHDQNRKLKSSLRKAKKEVSKLKEEKIYIEKVKESIDLKYRLVDERLFETLRDLKNLRKKYNEYTSESSSSSSSSSSPSSSGSDENPDAGWLP